MRPIFKNSYLYLTLMSKIDLKIRIVAKVNVNKKVIKNKKPNLNISKIKSTVSNSGNPWKNVADQVLANPEIH